MDSSADSSLIFAIGNTFIDCYAEANQELLDKYNLEFGVPGELTPDQLPVLKDLESYDNYHEMPGGSALNTVRCF